MPMNRNRVIAERLELRTKIIALETFLHGPTFHSLDIDEQRRLRRQYELMELLENVLIDRIRHFLEDAA